MYSSCIYLGMMAGSTVMGIALKRIGYPLGFAAAGGVNIVALVLFFVMMREKRGAGSGNTAMKTWSSKRTA